VLIVSLATTAYGWVYDQIVLLVPVVAFAAVVARSGGLVGHGPAVAGYLAVNATILAMNVAGVDAFWYIWVPFAFAGWWLAVPAGAALAAEAGRARLPYRDTPADALRRGA
jgi:hypothetical protein